MKKYEKVVFVVNTLNDFGGIHTLIDSFSELFSHEFGIEPSIIAVNENRVDFGNYKYINENISEYYSSHDLEKCIKLLGNPKNIVISLQLGAHFYYQKFIKTKKSFIIFAGNTKKIGTGKYFLKHLELINERDIYNYSKIVLLSEQSCNDMEAKMSKKIKKKCTFVNLFSLVEREDYYKKNNKYAIVSRLDDDKNLERYIDIAKLLNKNVTLHIYGDGSQKKHLKSLIVTNNLQKTIIMHGYTRIDEALKDKNGMLLGSYHEGVPFVLIEANAKHIPAICFNTFSSSNELVKEGTGRVFNYGDITGVAEALNNGLDREFESFECIANTFSYANSVVQWKNLLNSRSRLVKANKIKKNSDMNNLVPQNQLLNIFNKEGKNE